MSKQPSTEKESPLIEESSFSSESEKEVSEFSKEDPAGIEEEISENYDAQLDEWVKNLEPIKIFETEKEYPAVILEIFDIMMEQETVDLFKCRELLGIDVCGDENAFYVSYTFIDNEGFDNHLMIRVHKLENGEFALMAQGGGPLAYGLEKSDITIEDIG